MFPFSERAQAKNMAWPVEGGEAFWETSETVTIVPSLLSGGENPVSRKRLGGGEAEGCGGRGLLRHLFIRFHASRATARYTPLRHPSLHVPTQCPHYSND